MARAISSKQVAARSRPRLNQVAVQRARPARDGDSKLRSLIHKTPAATFIFSGDKNRLVNPAAEALTGYSSKELLGMNFWQIVHPDFQQMVEKRGRARQRGRLVDPSYELKIVRKDGTERWLKYCGAPIKYRGKMAVIGTAIDITDRKLAEEQLRRNFNQQRLIHEATLASMSTFDLASVLDIFLENVDALLPCPTVTTIRAVDTDTGKVIAKALRHIDVKDWERWVPEGGHGLTRKVLETKSPVFVADSLKDPTTRYPDFFRQTGLVSYLGLPLVYNNKVLGDIAFFTREMRRFTDEELEVLQNLASQAAIAIHNSQLYNGMNRRTRELSALNALTRVITQSLDLNAVLYEAAKSVVELFHFDGATVHLFNDVMTEAHLKSSFFSTPSLWGRVQVVKIDEGIIGRAARSGEPVIFENIQTDPRYAEQSKTQGWKGCGAKFFGVFPIQTKLKSWGALSCIAKSPKRLAAGEIDLLVAICEQIGIAIENASLFSNTAEKAKELSTLYAIAGISAQFVDMHALLYQSMRKLCEIFGFEAARIYVVDKVTSEIRLAAHDGISDDIEVPLSYQKGEGLVGLVVGRGEPLAFEDMENDPEFQRLAARKTMLRAGFRAALFIPLKVRGEQLGVINLLSKQTRSFPPAELQLINTTAYHLGIAVGNANLFSELRQKTQDLEKANRAKDEFLAIMSHELRTPVNVILGYLELVAQGTYGDIAPQLNANLQKVSSHAKDLLSMIESILIATSIEAGELRATVSEIGVAEFLNRIRSMYELPMGDAIQFAWDVPDESLKMNTDVDKLRRILQNLIDNAIKFTDRGRIEISAAAVAGKDRIAFTVRDTGEGIAQEKRLEIFKMFRQLDSSASRSHGGIGLGLYIVKQLTELLGGRVSLQSEPGKGSAFTVNLPLQS